MMQLLGLGQVAAACSAGMQEGPAWCRHPGRPRLTCADACRILIRSSCISDTTWSRSFSGSSAELTAIQRDVCEGLPRCSGCSIRKLSSLTYLIGVRLDYPHNPGEQVSLHHDGLARPAPTGHWAHYGARAVSLRPRAMTGRTCSSAHYLEILMA